MKRMYLLLAFATFFFSACGGGGAVSTPSTPASSKAITSFATTSPAVSGTINESAKTINLTVPNGTNVNALAPTFATSGASVTVGNIVQVSGVTTNNFTSPVIYTVTAADASIAQYTVTVVSASAKAITSFSILGSAGFINETAKTISVTVPIGTNVTALVATFATTGASVSVGSATQVSGTTANNFTSPVVYTVTSADNSTVQYTVTVTVAAASAKAITSFSILGAAGVINESTKTIAVEVPNGTSVTALVATFATTGASVSVGSTAQVSGTTANNFTSFLVYTVMAADSSTAQYTVTVTVAIAPASARAITSFSIFGAAGAINESAKTISVTVPNGTNVTALVATFATTGASVSAGSTAQVSGMTANNFTSPVVYTVTSADNSTAQYTVTVTVAAATAKAIINFTILGSAGFVNETAKTISVTVPNGTSVAALVATFATTGTSVSVGSTAQVSGVTANNFTSPVAYTVTAADSSTAQYTVVVTLAPSSAKAITSFSILGAAGVINETAKTIAVTVPDGTSMAALVATFATTGASVSIGSTAQVSGVTANDFTALVVYKVTATDSSMVQYTVTVTGRYITLVSNTFSVDLPSVISLLFQAKDIYGNYVTTLTNSDFNILEDGAPVAPNESFQDTQRQLPYTLKTVLLIDVSASISSADLANMKAAAKNMVTNMVNHQQIAIYTFDDRFIKVSDFSTNILNLNAAIDTISIGNPSTDLYGAVKQGLALWSDTLTTTGITKGYLIVITDGADTASVSTLSQAVAARGTKSIFTIGAGTYADTTSLTTLGNAGYIPIIDYSLLQTTLGQVSATMATAASSYYCLRYASPKRAGTHTLTLKVADNTNRSANAVITKPFNANGFYSITPLTSFTVTPTSPSIGLGMTQQFTATGTLSSGATQDLTYLTPTIWSSSEPGVATVSSTGLVTTLTSGTTTIYAIAPAVNMFKFASTVVTVP